MVNPFMGGSEVAVRLGVAVAAGAVIGINRSLNNKPAGLGTHALVALGGCLGTLVSVRIPEADTATVSRVIQGLVTGVGFIGAGEIIRARGDSDVHGITTAASVWTTSILGIVCGVADFAVCVIGVAFTLGILVLSKPVERLLFRVFRRDPDAPQ